MRTSVKIMQDILEENADNYSYLLQKIHSLESDYFVTWCPENSNLVNYSQNDNIPVHNWFKYKEAFSAELVKKLLQEFDVKENDRVLDPFSGSGTTLLVARKMGCSALGYDVNPVSVYIARTKNLKFVTSDLVSAERLLAEANYDSIAVENTDAPKLDIINKIFNKEQLSKVLKIRKYIDQIPESNAKEILRLAFISIIEPASNMKKDGNGIKYRKNYVPDDALKLFEDKVRQMIEDIREAGIIDIDKDCRVYEHSFIQGEEQEEKVKAIIFSPPYANCFDYCAVYKMELWVGGFIADYSDFKKLRKQAIRSNVNSSVSSTVEYEYDLINWIAEKLENIKLWDNKIPKMLKGYFDDMSKAIRKCYLMLKNGGKCAIVVANSCYKGFVVPTDLLLAECARAEGFRVDEIRVSRYLRTSSQQMIMDDELKKYLRESIIILSKE